MYTEVGNLIFSDLRNLYSLTKESPADGEFPCFVYVSKTEHEQLRSSDERYLSEEESITGYSYFCGIKVIETEKWASRFGLPLRERKIPMFSQYPSTDGRFIPINVSNGKSCTNCHQTASRPYWDTEYKQHIFCSLFCIVEWMSKQEGQSCQNL